MFLLSNHQPFHTPPRELFEQDLRAGIATSCLLTPTSTAAEHVRHTLARRGLLVRPDAIVTLSRFVEPLARDILPTSAANLDRIVARLLEVHTPEPFRALAHSKGLRRSLAALVEELSTAGCDATTLRETAISNPAKAFAEIYHRVENENTILRAQRLRMAARQLHQQGHPWKRIYLAGFYAFTPAELQILAALEPADVFISLPEWDGAAESRRALIQAGYRETQVDDPPRRATAAIIAAASDQQEAEDIARRILTLQSEGHAFREIGVILRREQPYAPLLQTTFRRYGIPARFYFQRTLSQHPVYRFLRQFTEALLSNWDYEKLIPLLRIKDVVDRDELDHKLRTQIPNYGFPPELNEALAKWRTFEHWRTATLLPTGWATELANLRDLVNQPLWRDAVPHDQVNEWRTLLSAQEAWNQTAIETAAILPQEAPLPLSTFLRHFTEVAEHAAIDDRDQRRNVVHVLDVYEARHWSLPVVFVPGMLERAFPQYHNEHPVLADEDRAQLRQRGIILRTSAERQREESFLFDTAVRAATAQLYLTYPRANAKGDETLPSFFIARFQRQHQPRTEPATPSRPKPHHAKVNPQRVIIKDEELLTGLRKARMVLSPTAIETYLQCPWQFFARHILKLRTPPPAPHERLDFLLQGSILHYTLAEAENAPMFVEEIFSRRFDEACRQHSLPPSCRTEKVRIDLHTNLRRFLESPPLKGAATLAVEDPFTLRLTSDLRIRGKMDRVAEIKDRGVVVIDYKYSTRQRVRGRVNEHDRGELVQGGLYLWAAEKVYKKTAAGMLYCGLRGDVSWAGWHLDIFGWQDIGESSSRDELRQMIDRAVEISKDVALRISLGEIVPEPADRKKCDWCDYRDSCRFETRPQPLVQIAGGA